MGLDDIHPVNNTAVCEWRAATRVQKKCDAFLKKPLSISRLSYFKCIIFTEKTSGSAHVSMHTATDIYFYSSCFCRDSVDFNTIVIFSISCVLCYY